MSTFVQILSEISAFQIRAKFLSILEPETDMYVTGSIQPYHVTAVWKVG